MKHIILRAAFVGIVSATMMHSPADASQRGFGPGSGQGSGRGQSNAALDEREAHELLSMREEEKLARDVYLALHEVWGAQTLLISGAEQRHMDALARAINRYSLVDPVVDTTPGVFADPAFGALYDELVAAGSSSLLDTMKVGALIEEMDIVDLQKALSVTTDPDLRRVYENLMRASRNHLRAFAAQIAGLDGTYQARYLSQDEFDAIASSAVERGRGSGRASGRGMGRGRGNARGSGQGARSGNGSGGGRANGLRAGCGGGNGGCEPLR